MIARRMAKVFAAVVLLSSGTYFFVYLWRWEWNRAVIAGIIFLAAEVGLGVSAVLDRLRELAGTSPAGRAPGSARPVDPDVLARVSEAAPAPRDHFAWLSPRQDGFGVFVPVLMGMGIVVSALAWAVERLAKATARPVLERRLAAGLSPLAWPQGGLAQVTGPGPADLLAAPGPTDLLAGPGRR